MYILSRGLPAVTDKLTKARKGRLEGRGDEGETKPSKATRPGIKTRM